VVAKEDRVAGKNNKMKHYLLITLFGIGLISITGCYTQLATNNDDSEEYYKPVQPIIIVVPTPPPIIISPIIEPPHPHPWAPYDPPDEPSKERVYKYRNPESDRPSDQKDRERPRNRGGRNGGERRGR